MADHSSARISVAIFVLVWQSAGQSLRMLDGMDAKTLEAIAHAAGHVPRVEEVSNVRLGGSHRFTPNST